MDLSPDPHRCRTSRISSATPPLAIVDDPTSKHGRRMARVLHPNTVINWIIPTLNLSDDLRATSAGVIALPLRIRGGHAQDPFTARLIAAIRWLGSRGCHVFVARGPYPNPLVEAGIAVAASADRTHNSASEACVAAAERAWLRLYASLE